MNGHPIPCPRCGTPLAGAALKGNCPACLSRRLLDAAGAPETDGEVGPALARLGDFELVEEMARGGMGVVFRARQLSLDRTVAVKVLRDGWLAADADIRRFRAEATNSARLNHPHIVAIHEAGEQDGQPYLVMDLVEGRDLAEVTRDGPLPARHAAAMVAAVADAVQHAHERGVLHRDLKPSNVLVDADGEPHVTDFGLSRPLDGDSSLTLTGQVLGTPGYLAPEQARGSAAVGPAADVYGLGAILFHLLAGRAPFVASSTAETLMQVLQQESLSPRLLNPSVPADLAAVCQKCLAKDPERRYDSARALAEELHRFLRGEATLARPSGMPERIARWCRRQPALASAVIAVHLVGLLGSTGIAWQWRRAVTAIDGARAATREKEEQLWNSQLIDARYYRTRGSPGQQREALAVLDQASAHRPSPELRNEAIAALLLPDLGKPAWFLKRRYGHWPLAFTRDLGCYVPFSAEGRVIVHRAGTHATLAELVPGRGHTLYLEFSPDDRHLAAHFEDGTVRVWEWRSGRQLIEARSDPNAPGGDNLPVFGFTPDGGELLAGWRGGGIRRFDLRSGHELGSPMPGASGVDGLRLHPGGGWLAVVQNDLVRLWDTTSTRWLDEVKVPSRPASLAWHPHEPILAIACLGQGILLKEPGQAEVRLPPDHDASTRVLFSPDGDLLVTGGHGNNTVVWDRVARRPLLVADDGYAIQSSQDGRHMAFGLEPTGFGVRPVFWPVGLRRLVIPPALGANTLGGAFVRDGGFLVTAHANGLLFWEAATARLAAQHPGPVASLGGVLTQDAGLLLGTATGPVLLPLDWGGKAARPGLGASHPLFPMPLDGLDRATLAPDGDTVAVGGDAGLALTSIREPRELVSLADSGRRLHYLGFSADQKWLVTGYGHDDGIEIYEVSTRRHVRHLRTGSRFFAFSPDRQRLLSGSSEGYGYWSVGNWEAILRREFTDPTGSMLTGCGFGPDGSGAFFTDRAGRLLLRTVATDEPVMQLGSFEPTGAWGIAHDPDGRRFAAWSSRNVVHLWDLTALRTELARSGLDWTGDRASPRIGETPPR